MTVDLTTAPTGSNPLRWRNRISLEGAGDVSAVGTAFPTPGVTDNEFEVGQSDEPSVLPVNDYSGTLSGSQHVDLEIHNSLPNAKLVANADATIEVGHRAVQAAFNIELGEVEVANGGTLIVGFAENGSHFAHTLELTSSGSRDGDLTLAAGSKLVMQVNGTADGEFDAIIAQGDVSLGGELEILVNPTASSGTNPTYAPTLGDTFDLITLAPSPTLGADSTAAIPWTILTWRSGKATSESTATRTQTVTATPTSSIFWRSSRSSASPPPLNGTLTGTFGSLTVTDPGNVMVGAGLAFQVNVTATGVQLEVISASPVVAVPEPTTLGMIALGAVLSLSRRRKDA